MKRAAAAGAEARRQPDGDHDSQHQASGRTRCAGPAQTSPPAPPYIFMVPLGPKLVLSTSCSPRAALMLTANAAWARATSALGFRVFTAAIVDLAEEERQIRLKIALSRFNVAQRRYPGLLEKSDAPCPPTACPRAATIGSRLSRFCSLGRGNTGPPLTPGLQSSSALEEELIHRFQRLVGLWVTSGELSFANGPLKTKAGWLELLCRWLGLWACASRVAGELACFSGGL